MKEQKSKKTIIFIAIVLVIVISAVVIGIAATPKYEKLKVTYNGDTQADVVLNKDNDGIIVMGITKDGTEKEIKGWSIEEEKTLKEDSSATITVTYKKLHKALTVKCSSSAIVDIFAEYKGSLAAGTSINTSKNDVTVFARHKNGKNTEITDDCTFDPAIVTLEKDGEETLHVNYNGFSYDLELVCSDKSVIVDGIFAFSPKTFYEMFSDTIPSQYSLTKELVNNPFRHNYLQYGIQYSDASKTGFDANTGIRIYFNETNKNAELTEIALVTGTDTSVKGKEYTTILSWFLQILLPDNDENSINKKVTAITDHFSKDASSASKIDGDNYSLIISMDSDGLLKSYFVTIKIVSSENATVTAVEEFFNKACSITIDDLTIKDYNKNTGEPNYYYNDIYIIPEEIEFLNASYNKKGVLDKDALYNSIAQFNYDLTSTLSESSIPSQLKKLNELFVLEKEISGTYPIVAIMKKLQSLTCTTGTFDYDYKTTGKYSVDIVDLSKCATELEISEELLAYILAELDCYSNVVFDGNSCHFEHESFM